MLALRRQLRPRAPVCRACARAIASHSKVFAEGDIVLLRNKKKPQHPGILTKPLSPGVVINNQHGTIQHSAIIGKRPRDLIPVTKTEYRIHDPTLDEYVRLTPRIVTPIYSNDASFIVHLLDIHVSPQPHGGAPSEPLEILEAGTGHGSLTLHLARAIHAANPPLPPAYHVEAPTEDAAHPLEDATYESMIADHSAEHTVESWKKHRKAIVHTLDISSRHAKHAKKIVKGFRRGIYANNVDFHVGDVSAWINARFQSQSTEEPRPFLSYVFLDLAGADKHLELVAKAMHPDGALAVFNPSVTQIAEAAQTVKKLNLPFALETVVELKGSDTVREWDVRAAQLKAAKRAAKLAEPEATEEEDEDHASLENVEGIPVDDQAVPESSEKEASLTEQAIQEAENLERSEREREEQLAQSDEDWKLICRPKTGLTVGVGGFVGLWRRLRKNEDY